MVFSLLGKKFHRSSQSWNKGRGKFIRAIIYYRSTRIETNFIPVYLYNFPDAIKSRDWNPCDISTDKPRYDRFTRSILARGSNIFVRLLRSWKKRWHPLSNPSSIFERTSISLDSWSPKFLRFHTRILLLQPQRSPDIFTRIDTHERYIRISRSKKNLPVGEIKSRFKLVRVAKLDRNCKKAPSIGIEFLIGAEKIPFYCDPLLGIRPCPVSMSSPSLSLSLQGSPFFFLFLFSPFFHSFFFQVGDKGAPSARIHACSLHTSEWLFVSLSPPSPPPPSSLSREGEREKREFDNVSCRNAIS